MSGSEKALEVDIWLMTITRQIKVFNVLYFTS